MRRWLPLADPLALPLLPAMPVSEVGMINLFKGIRSSVQVDQQAIAHVLCFQRVVSSVIWICLASSVRGKLQVGQLVMSL